LRSAKCLGAAGKEVGRAWTYTSNFREDKACRFFYELRFAALDASRSLAITSR
jgi:hypothetical protein